MATNFPTSVDDASTVGDGTHPSADEALSSTDGGPAHHSLHQNVGLAINAIEDKVGTGASTPAANSVLAGTGSGTSAWTTGTIANNTSGNATTATTATNLSGGTVAATTLTASGNVNLDSDTLFVDASTNRVGIRQTSPAHPLDVDGTIQATGNIRVEGDLYVGKNGGSDSRIYFYDDNSNTTRALIWDDSANQFDFGGAAKVNGNFVASGSVTADSFSGTLDGDDLTTGTVAAAQIDTAIARKSGVYAFEDNTGYNITASTGSGTPSSSGRGDGDIHIYYTT